MKLLNVWIRCSRVSHFWDFTSIAVESVEISNFFILVYIFWLGVISINFRTFGFFVFFLCLEKFRCDILPPLWFNWWFFSVIASLVMIDVFFYSTLAGRKISKKSLLSMVDFEHVVARMRVSVCLFIFLFVSLRRVAAVMSVVFYFLSDLWCS